MYISNSKKLLFIAIPKTGCSSILYSLASDKPISKDSPTHVWNFKYPEIYHSTLESTLKNLDTIEHLGFNIIDVTYGNSYDNFRDFEDAYIEYENKLQSKIIEEQYYKFAFVRNPWDRFVSGYMDLNKHVPGRFSKRYSPLATQEETPNWYKSWDFENFNDFCLRFKESGWYKDTHFKPQFDFVSIDGKLSVDFIGRFENLNDDYQQVLNNIGSEPLPLLHIHKSNRERYRSYYTEETKEIVREFYKKDIEEFSYEF
jgi:hypothetical protein